MIRPLHFDELELALELCSSLTLEQKGLNSHIDSSWVESEFASAEVYAEIQDKISSLVFLRRGADHDEITFIARRPGNPHKGAANRILKFLQGAAEKPIWLEVHEDNRAAQSLYTLLGFERVGRREKYYRGQKAALLYSWEP